MKRVLPLIMAVVVAAVFISAVKAPDKPTRDQIARDLVGVRLNEGYEDGWFPEDWYWVVKKGQVKALKIIEVLDNTDKNYCVVVMVRLQDDVNAFNARVKINYRLTRNNSWRVEYVYSQGIDIVKTNKYNDCLHLSIEPTGFFFTDVLEIKNKSNLELRCAGMVKSLGGWRKFSVVLDPYATVKVEGTSDVTNYKIEFIERA